MDKIVSEYAGRNRRIGNSIAKCSLMVLVLLVVLRTTALGQDTDPEALQNQSKPITLTQAINVSLANNNRIKRSLLSLKDADEQVKIAWSDVLPEVSGSAAYTRNIELPVFFFPADPTDPNSELRAIQAGEDNNWNGGITLEQTIFRGEAIIGISSSQLFKAAQAENLRATTQQIVTDTRVAYYNVLIAEEQFRLQQATVERLRKNLEDNRARSRAGLIDEYEVTQVEVQLSNQEPQLTEARYGVAQAYRELKLVMGIPVELDLSVQGDLGSYDILEDETSNPENRNIKKVDGMTPYAFERNPQVMEVATDLRGDIRVLEKQNQLKEREIKAIKSRFLPSLSTRYNVGWRAEEPGAPDFFGNDRQRVRTQSVSLNLSVPIFQGFERSANLQIAQIEKKDLQLQKEFAIRSARNEIQAARESLNQAIETAPARERALRQAQTGYDRAVARLENGIGSQLDVSNAEFQLRQAELNYARMVFNYLSAKARYDEAIGMVPFVEEEKPELH